MTKPRQAVTRARLTAGLFLSSVGAMVAFAGPASAATPTIVPPSIDCNGVLSAIRGSGFSPGALIAVAEPVTGFTTPGVPASALGNVTIPGFTIPGAQYLPGSSIPLNVLQSGTNVGSFPVTLPSSCPSLNAFGTGAPVAISSINTNPTLPYLGSGQTSIALPTAPGLNTTQPVSNSTFSAGSGSTGDDALRQSSSTGPMLMAAAILGVIAAGAGAVSMRKGRVRK